MGQWRLVNIDDFIPCFPNGDPMFSRNSTNQIWMMLLEKAYAKLHGGYKNIMYGQVTDALSDLTGCACSTFKLDDEQVK